MKVTLLRVDVLFLLTGLILLSFCFFFSIEDQTLDVTIHDAYFVIDPLTIGLYLFALNAFYSIVYFLIRKYQKYSLGIIHLILSLPLFVFSFQVLLGAFAISGPTRRYYTNSDPGLFEENSLMNYLTIVLVLFGLGLLMFFINVTLAIVKRVNTRER